MNGPYDVGGTRLSGPLFNVRSPIAFRRARQACPSEKIPEGPFLE
jgi:hypothetical protein